MTAAFSIEYTPQAARQIRKLDRSDRLRVLRTVEVLAETPRPPAAKPLVGSGGAWRVRTGDFRIVYEIHDSRLVVLVVQVGHRREVYKR